MSSARASGGGGDGNAGEGSQPGVTGRTARFKGDDPPWPKSVRDIELEVIDGPAAGRSYRSRGTSCTVGSAALCDLAIDDPTVSRFHCEILIGDDGARLRDTGSLNGTILDGVHVVDAYLRGGSTVRLGRTSIRFDFGVERHPLQLSAARQFGLLTGESVAMRRIFSLFERAAASDATVLLEGETGTGKTAAARSIHQESARKGGPFVVLDCGAVPAGLIEDELFGHERGAFTGADNRRAGVFEEASGGTLFLDEIGELPPELQPKLLGVLEGREVRRIGSARTTPVDVRLIAATNRDLRQEANSGAFRPDLYYRLAVVRVEMPPLRSRPEDIPAITAHLLRELGGSEEAIARLSGPGFTDALRRAAWRGNVRELKNYLERCLVFEQVLPIEDTLGGGGPAIDASVPFADAKRRAADRFERDYLVDLLRRHDGVVVGAAEAAGLDRTHLYRLLRKHRISPR
jgi:two-component system, NtrC family, response regulator GlrR